MKNDATGVAIDNGWKSAEEVLSVRQSARARRAQALSVHPTKLEFTLQAIVTEGTAIVAPATFQTAGFLVAAGDSWFDYPVHDVLKLLDDNYGYNIESAAHRGDPIEAMVSPGEGQLDKLARCFEKVLDRGGVPKAVLLSGGGDDIAGKEFGMLLNNATSSIGGWNDEIVDGVINQRIATAYKRMLGSIDCLCHHYLQKSLPVLVHGYDYAVPDGRGFLGGWLFFPGPWLEPGFREKRFIDLVQNVTLIHQIIDRFNEMLSALVKLPAFGYVRYLDLRNTLSSVLTDEAYQKWWANELHPTPRGFDAITDKFAAELGKL